MLLKLERDENTCRKEMTASEMLDLARRLEALEKPRATQRMSAGGQGGVKVAQDGATLPGEVSDQPPSAHSSHYKVSEVIGPAVGLSACC